MKIVVCVKQVPDTAAKVVVEDGQITWGDSPLVINPWDEYAVETALIQQEAHGGEVTVISVGGEDAKEALKHALAMGCGNAILVSEPGIEKSDSLLTSRILAAAIQKIGDVDAAFFGRQAIDGDVGVTAAQTARVLGWPSLTLVSAITELDPGNNTVRVERSIEEGRQVVEGKLPAVISVVKDIGEPRYPSFMGIRRASRAEIPIWSTSDIGAELSEPAVTWPEITNPPQQEVVTELVTGGSPEEIAEKLADKILEEKVL
ncbi:MAG: electron transfer flavoprotein subunit beta/FixA family protein [Anaerolineales bacterium]|nr:electron transfer flavoprotein subunit beta/FixA family protein [Anaerolineales bacterium]